MRRSRALISVAIVLHLFAVVLAPNSQTYLGYRMAFWIEPYVNFFELVSSWNFFAPDPGPPPIAVEWELQARNGGETGIGRWPEEVDPYFFRERQNRRIASARFMIASDERAEKMLGSYLCRLHPDAYSVRLWRSQEPVPPLDDVAAGRRRIGDHEGRERKVIGQLFCEGRS